MRIAQAACPEKPKIAGLELDTERVISEWKEPEVSALSSERRREGPGAVYLTVLQVFP
jgi:hypothetical protein